MSLVARMKLLMIVVWLTCFLLPDCIPGLDLVLVSAKQRSGYTLFRARCEVVCGKNNTCIEDCLINLKSNPGDCPSRAYSLEAACIRECIYDTQCPETKKCCTHSCGVTCQTPDGLLNYQGLPDIPNNLTVREIRKNKSAQLIWNPVYGEERIIYVLQQCSHAGRRFNPSNLSPWTTRHHVKRNSIVVKELRPGNWYLFRVASVNKNGTKGFSEPPDPFTLSEGPKPPKAPTNLRVVNTGLVNGSLWVELLWNAPQSDLPIQKYKVYWSLRLNPGPPPGPLLVRHKNVPNARTSFILKKLKPDAEYFLQVEAYSRFGRERLKGERGNLSYNTTDYKNETSSEYSERLYVKKLWVRRIDDEIKARIMWSGSKFTAGTLPKFVVSWKSIKSCSGEMIEMSSTTHGTSYDLIGLHPGCKYRVYVKETGLGYTRSGELYIYVPLL